MAKLYRAVFTSHEDEYPAQGEAFHIEATCDDSDPLWMVAVKLVQQHMEWSASGASHFLQNKAYDLRIVCDDGIVSADDIVFPWNQRAEESRKMARMRQSFAALNAAIAWVRETSGVEITPVGMQTLHRVIAEQHTKVMQLKEISDQYGNISSLLSSIPDKFYREEDKREIDISAQESEM